MACMTNLLETLILKGCKMAGTFEPESVLSFFAEDLTNDEYDLAHHFLCWVYRDVKTRAFGHGNIRERFADFLADPNPGPPMAHTHH